MLRFQITPIVKNLIVINVIVYLAQLSFDNWLVSYCGLFPIGSPFFRFHQIISHLFLHSRDSIFHLLFNMLVLWSFGTIMEQVWKPKRFIIFYFICGIGAAVLHEVATFIQMQYNLSQTFMGSYGLFSEERLSALQMMPQATVPAIGASGAISGLIAGFALLFPNSIILVWFIPAKAKYVAMFMFLYEIASGTWGGDSSIANWAHIGGGITGLILAYFWKRKGYHL